MTEDGDKATGSVQGTSSERARERDVSRTRSTIGFPYWHLEEAINIVAAVHEVGGRSCEWSQVAAKAGQSPRGGAFRQKMLATRTFGLLDYKGQEVELTDLGLHSVDPRSEKSARVEAFLHVPLFAQAFEKFRDHPLPPATAIESQMEQMGVTPKQTDKARQVFLRSARFAGFFDLAGDRLVKPSINGPPEASSNNDGGGGTDSSESPESPPHHPFVEGLLRELPDAESEWKLERRVKWLRTAANIFDMIYEDSEESREIQINIRQEDTHGGGVQ